jgi:hypothetical protein
LPELATGDWRLATDMISDHLKETEQLAGRVDELGRHL